MNNNELIMLQSLPLDVKIMKSKQRIGEFIRYFGRDKVYGTISGIDSRVVYDLTMEVDSSIPFVYCNTGLEFRELLDYNKALPNVKVIRPDMIHTDVLTRYGYPVISKQISASIYKLRHHNLSDKYRNYLLNGDDRGKIGMIPKSYQYLQDVDFEVSAICCDVMKKRPFKRYAKETGRYAFFTGEMADESRLRRRVYMKTGCNAYDRVDGPKSMPTGFWTKNDVLEYYHIRKLEMPKVYGEVFQSDTKIIGNTKKPIFKTTGYDRTGCIFCAYGCHLESPEDNRFCKLERTHPELHDYCMRGGKYNEKGLWVPDKGLGMAHVLDTLNIKYREE